MWEDDVNKDGGRWVMFLDKDSKELVDKLWHDLVSGLHSIRPTWKGILI